MINSVYKKRFLASIVALVLLLSATGYASEPLPPGNVVSSITVSDLRKHVSFLASDEVGGRYTFSPSIRVAGRYLASALESYGYRGALDDGSFLQQVPLAYRSMVNSKTSLFLDAGGVRQEFHYVDDFVLERPAALNFTGDLCFVGYGISSPGNAHDDYSGLDIRGKIVVLASGVPRSLRGVRLKESEKGIEAARTRGAAAVIVIPPAPVVSQWSILRSQWLGEQLGLPPRGMPVALAGPRLVKALAALLSIEESYLAAPGGRRLEPTAMKASAAASGSVQIREAPPTFNVIGVLEGSDANLKNEYVVFSAHYDHLETSPNGEVFNGADDDASGTAAVLEIAEALSMGPRPKRSILIVFHTAEELGLFGSEFNTDHEPVVPLDRLVANFNIDMIGRSRTDDNNDRRDRELTDANSLYVIGADKLSTELNVISEQTNAETEKLSFDYTYNSEDHPSQFYYRSDHYNYAKNGIPVIFYFTGPHRDYHQPTDDVDKLDFEKMARITRLILATGWRVANRSQRLVVDKSPALNKVH